MSKDEKKVPIDVAAETMLGDFMALHVQELRASKKPWDAMSEDEQRDALHRTEMSVRQSITKATKIISSDNRAITSAALEQVVFKDGVKAVLKLPKDSASAQFLTDAVGKSVYLVFADPEQHMGGSEAVKADAQQRPLLDAGHGPH